MVMSSLTASKKVLRALSLSLGGVPSTLVMERSYSASRRGDIYF